MEFLDKLTSNASGQNLEKVLFQILIISNNKLFVSLRGFSLIEFAILIVVLQLIIDQELVAVVVKGNLVFNEVIDIVDVFRFKFIN